jgi:uncharacterized damage-inducible protein DinB
MDLVTDRLFRHMAWANAYVFDCLATLTDEQLQLTARNDDWSAASILEHISGASARYADLLDGLGKTAITLPHNSAEVLALKEITSAIDIRMREAAKKPEGFVEFIHAWEGTLIHRARQTILSQMIHHATEHRAQIAGIFASHGIKVVDLDAIDLWAFADFEGVGD